MHDLIAMTPQRSDERWRDPERRHLMSIHQRPGAIGSREIGRAIVKHHRRAKQQNAEYFPRTHHPTHVRHPEKCLVRMKIETLPHVLGGFDWEPTMRMHGALRLTSRTRRVDDHDWIFRARALGRLFVK